MDDAAAAMRRLKSELQDAGGVAVEAGADGHERFDGVGSAGKNALRRRRVAEPVPGRERVGEMLPGVVIGPDAGGDAALRPDARRFGPERRRRQNDDRTRRQMQRRHQAGKAAADDDRLAGKRRGGAHRTASIRSTARRAGSATDGSIRTS